MRMPRLLTRLTYSRCARHSIAVERVSRDELGPERCSEEESDGGRTTSRRHDSDKEGTDWVREPEPSQFCTVGSPSSSSSVRGPNSLPNSRVEPAPRRQRRTSPAGMSTFAVPPRPTQVLLTAQYHQLSKTDGLYMSFSPCQCSNIKTFSSRFVGGDQAETHGVLSKRVLDSSTSNPCRSLERCPFRLKSSV